MTRIGIYSNNLFNPTNKCINLSLAWFIVFNLLMVLISSTVFIEKNLSNFKAVLETVLVMVAAIQSLGAYLNTAVKTHKVKAVHLKLQEIVDKCMFFYIKPKLNAVQ